MSQRGKRQPNSPSFVLLIPHSTPTGAMQGSRKFNEKGRMWFALHTAGRWCRYSPSRILSRSRVGTSPLRMSLRMSPSPAGRPVIVQSGGDIGFTPRLSSLCSCSFSHSRCSAEAILRVAWACRRHCRRHRCVHRLETVAKFNQPGEAGD